MLETDKITLWTPSKSDVLKHGKWIKEESGFPIGTYPIHLILHAHGENVLTMDGVDMLFRNFDKNLKKHDTYRGNWHYWTPAWGQNDHEHAGIQLSQSVDKAIETMTEWREALQEARVDNYFGGIQEFNLVYGAQFGRNGIDEIAEIIHGDPIE